MNSILNTVKLALGVETDYNGFDINILLDINSAIFSLNQLGVGPVNGFAVIGEGETWEDLLGNGNQFELAKSYIVSKVRLSFDPPANSFLVDSLQKNIQEIEWRLTVQKEYLHYQTENVILSNLRYVNTEGSI